MFEVFLQFVNYLVLAINKTGYLGIFIGMTVESSFFPFPSEVILIPAGVLIAQGEMNFLPVFLAGLLGSLLGATINYAIALFVGRFGVEFLVDKYGKFLFLSRTKLKHYDDYFKKHGDITTFTGRLIPGVRQLISLPAGFSRMNFPKFIFFTSLGAGIWTAVLIFVGYFFNNNYDFIVREIDILMIFFVLIVVVFYILLKRKN
ncbi:MAG: DedA family protein [archaeon]